MDEATQESIDNSSTSVLKNVEEGASLLSCLLGPADVVLFRPIETWTEAGQKRSRVVYKHTLYRWGHPISIKLVLLQLLEIAPEHRANLYFGVCPRFGPKGRFDQAWQIRTVRTLWADIDHVTVEEALERVEKAGLPKPSIVVNSGNGVHLYWLLDEPYRIDDAGNPPPVEAEWREEKGKPTSFRYFVDASGERIDVSKKSLCPKLSPKAQRIQDIVGGLAAKIGGDHTKDLSRLLRIPGTMNRKDERNGKTPVPCSLVELHADRRFALSEFEHLAAASPDVHRREKIAHMPLPTVRKKISPTAQDKLNQAIARSRCAERGFRSEADFALCCEAIRLRVSSASLWSQVQDVGKFQEGGESYFHRTWEAAAATAREEAYERHHNNPPESHKNDQSPVGSLSKLRPTVVIDVDEARVADQSIAALARLPGVYQRGGVLVQIVKNPPPPPFLVRPDGGIRIQAIPVPRLRELLTMAADFVIVSEKAGEMPCHPREWLVNAVHARAYWPGIPRLEGIVETPVLLADGSVLQQPGYDPRSGLFFSPSASFPPVPEAPSLADAESARDQLLETIVDFPLKNPAYRSAWLAYALTPAARYAVDGPNPLLAIDANTRGSGKTLMADTIGVIYTGRRLPRTSAPKDDEECRKKITSIALEGETFVLFDNASGNFGCPSLDAALTATTWSDRLLGANKTTGSLPLNTLWFVNGNNLVLVGDTPRRAMNIRLESDLENPEERSGFTHPNLLDWVRRHRPRLAVAALTILKAYVIAGKPDMELKEWGSFDAWSRLVRNAVVWCGTEDPASTRCEWNEGGRGDAHFIRLMMAAWEQADPKRHGMTVSEAVRRSAEEQCGLLREALAEITPADKKLSCRSIGMKLSHMRGRVCGGRRFVRDDANGTGVWKLENAGDGQSGGRAGSGTTGTKGTSSCSSKERDDASSVCVNAHARREPAGNSSFSSSSSRPACNAADAHVDTGERGTATWKL